MISILAGKKKNITWQVFLNGIVLWMHLFVFSVGRLDELYKEYSVNTMDEFTTWYCRCVTVNTTRQTHLLNWFFFSHFPSGKTSSNLLTDITVEALLDWVRVVNVCSLCFIQWWLRYCVQYYMHVTTQLGLSHDPVAATIKGYCRNFTAQWRESIAHASGHKYGEPLKHKQICRFPYVKT